MHALYRRLLSLYPAEFRRDFGEEMECVFAEADAAAMRAGAVYRCKFYAREMAGMLGGAVVEQVGSIAGLNLDMRRFAVMSNRNRFRFPVAGITFMVMSLGLILWAIRMARMIAQSFTSRVYVYGGHSYYYEPDRWSFVATFGFAFVVTVVLTVVVCAVLHKMHRSGAHRLEDAQTWPQQ